MIGLVAHAINWCVACVWSLLVTTAFVGQVIVSILTTVLNGVWGVFSFVADVYKDNRNSFCVELPSMVLNAPAAVMGHFRAAGNVFGTAFSVILARGGAVLELASFCLNIVFSSFISAALFLKKTLILIGDSLWLIITFIPIHLPALLGYIFSYFWRCFVEFVVSAYSSLLKLTNFLTDVPLQSLIGIVSSVVIVRLFVEFREEIISGLTAVYWSLVRKMLIHYYTVYNYFTNSDTRIITQLVQERQLMEGTDQEGPGAMDALCVVCQERQKCVLILPCRHICLCRECCMRLYRYQRTCPICRAFIYHSVAVYI